jgi:hypothetical protein
MFHDSKKGQRVVKALSVHGVETASIEIIAKVSKAKGRVYIDPNNLDDEGVSTFRIDDGRSICNTYPAYARLPVLTSEPKP